MSDGVQKLTEYLNQTRRQAESAIDILNDKIRSLVNENDDLLKALKSSKLEKDHYKEAADRLQKENSKKWKFQERDDWKALVDSVQRDRAQLQEENNALKARLEAESEKNNMLQNEIIILSEEIRRLAAHADPQSTGSSATTTTISQHLAGHATPTPTLHTDGFSDVPLTPSNGAISSHGLSGEDMTSSDLSPRSSTIVSLRTELDQVQRKMVMERKLAAKEVQAQTDEIKALKRRLTAANNSVSAYASLPTPIHYMARDRFLPGEISESPMDLLDLPDGDDDDDALFTWNGLYAIMFPPAPSNLRSYEHAKVLKV